MAHKYEKHHMTGHVEFFPADDWVYAHEHFPQVMKELDVFKEARAKIGMAATLKKHENALKEKHAIRNLP